MSEPLCLLTVHAHPDDESSKGPGTVARYHSEGVRTVLVCCTGGEEGDILNPAMDRPEVRERLVELRREELDRATAIIGYDEVVMLGYRDSGMPDTEANANPGCFARRPLEEAVQALVGAIRRARPQVVVTYGDDQRAYPHPDHLRVHEVSVAAFEAAGDPAAYPDAGSPWQPLKLYYTVWARARWLAMHEKFLELGLTSPFSPEWLERPSQDHLVTTRVDIAPWADVRLDALLAHRTQVDPNSQRWFGLPREIARTVHPVEEYVLAADLTGAPRTGETEDDLFAGVREQVAS
ncbi:MAG TPA: mycothiol conjugate amidase Mca [Acidimicrobiales bacterium]|jgi:mycothiol S-conjugate amidase|nr:mycothiol conjugate amidase Mca [Acidimicrobiales bacterium]